jgi:hypothetical protein
MGRWRGHPEPMKAQADAGPFGHDARQAVPRGKPSVMAPMQEFCEREPVSQELLSIP